MYSQIITHVGNGTAKSYDLKFDAVAAWIIPDASAHIGYHHPTMWTARSNAVGARDSISSGIRILGRKLLVGADASVNTSGVTYRIVAIGAESGDIETPSWCGNATAGRTIKLSRAETPIFASCKRDSARPTVAKIAGAVTAAMDGSTVGDSITLAAGLLTLTADPEVNEWAPAAEIGEAHDALICYSGSANVGSYTGSGAAQVVSVGCDAAMVMIWRPGSAETAKIFVRGAVGGFAKAADTSAPIAAGTLMRGRLALSGAVANNSGGAYRYLAIPLREPMAALPLPSQPIVRGKKALFLTGRGVVGNVDCGTGLNINGAITLEWLGEIPGDAQSGAGFDGWLLGKAATGQSVSAGGASWGMSTITRVDGGFGWQGPHATAVVNGRVWYSTPLDTASWRTGRVIPAGLHHHVYVHRGSGESEYWLDGVLIKQRKIATDSIVSNAAHKVSMGARWTGSAFSNNSRMLIVGARVYARALSDAEVIARHERARLGSSVADVTTGLSAAWDGDGLSGATWTDAAGGNTGTIVGGTIITL